MKRLFTAAAITCIVMLAGACSSEQEHGSKTEITVSAAASLNEALSETARNFSKKHPDIEVIFNFGGSGALQQQIIQGAPVDVFISASENKFSELIEKKIISKHTELLGNKLVLIVNKSKGPDAASFQDLTDKAFKQISIGIPESVPAGQYALQTLEGLGLWQALEGRIIQAKDVRQVLTYVETGNVDAGIVYKTDALQSEKVKIAAEADPSLHEPIIYPAGTMESSEHSEESRVFLDYLNSDEAQRVFEKYGFIVLDGSSNE